MTHEEETAIALFCKMVAELNDSVRQTQHLKAGETKLERKIGSIIERWVDTLRAGWTQEELNDLVLKLVSQENPQNA